MTRLTWFLVILGLVFIGVIVPLIETSGGTGVSIIWIIPVALVIGGIIFMFAKYTGPPKKEIPIVGSGRESKSHEEFDGWFAHAAEEAQELQEMGERLMRVRPSNWKPPKRVFRWKARKFTRA